MTLSASQTAGGSCGCTAEEEEGCRDDAAALRLKLAAILVAGMVGVAIPLAAEEEEGCRDDAVAEAGGDGGDPGGGDAGRGDLAGGGVEATGLLSTESGFFALAKAFAAGVILATGFVHMLHDSEAALTDPYLPRFP
uniref:Uncharacterized protein n=1 Tax=Ananas comosus var. bracteatus TaxID=296719 RepID=A0A6V7QSL8_ANACO